MVGVGLGLAGRRREEAPPVVSQAGRAARNARVARLGGRTGGRYAVHRARSVFAGADRRRELEAEFGLKTAEDVAGALGQMKGAMMKLGQMASYLDQGLPSPVRQALADLQQDAPAMAPELAAQVVEAELGQPPDRLFEEWDPVPIASASIGQVHRAITRDERAVAVKVQYPGVDEAIRSDLDNVDLLFGATGMAFGGLDPEGLTAELKDRLGEELDYRHEAANQRLFADYYRDHPFIHVPDVVDELSSLRVLTTDLADGARFAEAETWDGDERDLAGEAIDRFAFRSLYRLHAFNGDPHPGNYLFHGGGRVTFLDFGLVKRFTPEEVDLFEAMTRAMVVERDGVAYRRIIEDAGLLRRDDSLSDEQVADYFSHFYELVLHDRMFTVDPAYASATIRQMLDLAGPHGPVLRAANVPPSFVILQRINLGLFAVLGQLRATANWRRIGEELWPFVDAPPSTELGELEAEWLERRKA